MRLNGDALLCCQSFKLAFQIKKIAAKTNEVKEQENTIASIERELDPSIPSSYAGQIQAIAKELSITNYFTVISIACA